MEELFGNAEAEDNPTGIQSVVAADERREMLAEGERLLDDYGLSAHFVPQEFGGRLTGLQGLIHVMRALYRRDPALGLGYGTSSLLAAVNVWTSGRTDQRSELAKLLLDGSKVACAYHELAHGNDLGRAEVTATSVPNGLRLNGSKEVIANLGRADAMVLFARTAQGSGGRSHSQLFLKKDQLPATQARQLPRFHTAGMRGVQLGGIEFADCLVPSETVVGAPGHGLETALRSFQTTRIALPGMTIGILDTALRTAVRCTSDRRLYGRTAADLPLSRTVLAEAFADLLLADTLTTVSARAMHTAPGQAGNYAAATKAFVPKTLMAALHKLSGLLGSQFYLRTGPYALFQKLLRDGLPSGFGHASRASCLTALLPQIPVTARRTWGNDKAPSLDGSTFRLTASLPGLSFDALRVSGAGHDPLARALPAGLAAHPPGSDGMARRIRERAEEAVGDLTEFAAECAKLTPRDLGPDAPARSFDLAERWCEILAASAVLNLWWHNHERRDHVADPVWVVAALHRIDAHAGRRVGPLPPELVEPLYRELLRREAAGLTFDLSCQATGC
ncbi:acyl-CoA dehydrogenase [Streptomyces sp. MB09-02B]|nr:acyl-CoA dehydrogenase [Streptomyces sp. MB09-02B]